MVEKSMRTTAFTSNPSSHSDTCTLLFNWINGVAHSRLQQKHRLLVMPSFSPHKRT